MSSRILINSCRFEFKSQTKINGHMYYCIMNVKVQFRKWILTFNAFFQIGWWLRLMNTQYVILNTKVNTENRWIAFNKAWNKRRKQKIIRILILIHNMLLLLMMLPQRLFRATYSIFSLSNLPICRMDWRDRLLFLVVIYVKALYNSNAVYYHL